MKKHALGMVFLLILTLSLLSAVSASDNVTLSDNAPILESQDENQMEIASEFESSQEISSDCGDSELICQDEQAPPVTLSAGEGEIHDRSCDSDYELGYEIASDFISNVDTDDCGEVLVIANAGLFQINNRTAETVLDGILDASKGYITYEDGNLIMISSTADSVNVAFLYKNKESLTIALYDDSLNHVYIDNAGPEISASQLEKLKLNTQDINSYLNIIKSWANGRLDELNLSTYQRYVPFGRMGGNYKLQTVKNYPHEFDLPLADALGVSRDFDDDAFILKKSNSSDELASVAVSMVGRSMEESSDISLYDIGVDASNKALKYLKSKGVDIPKDYPYLYVLTSAGHVKVDGRKTDEVLDGLLDALGPKFNKKHLITVDDPSWKDLVFYFIVVKDTKFVSYALKYDSATGKLIESDKAKEQGDNMAEKRGLYSSSHKGHNSYEPSIESSHEIISNSSAHDLNQTLQANVTGSNSTGNISNVTNNVNKSNDTVEVPKGNRGSPFNFLYTLAAILIVCVIFGMGYRKR